MTEHRPIPLEAVQAARGRIAKTVVRTPLVHLELEDAPAEIYLKLENLQPIGSFKMRGAGNAILAADRERLAGGVWTASAGNMAQGVAWYAGRLGIPCKVIVPDDASSAKLAALRRLGAEIVPVSFSEYQDIQRAHTCEQAAGVLIHPFADDVVMAGNGTIALEILEDQRDVQAVIVPYGGGGLSCGIASAVKAINPKVKVYAAEVASGAPLAASLAAGRPVEVPYVSSFVSGMGAAFVFPEMWSLASQLLDGSIAVELPQVADALRLMIERNRVVAEGAGAVALAAALTGKAGCGKTACIVSGGNIGTGQLIQILKGGVP